VMESLPGFIPVPRWQKGSLGMQRADRIVETNPIAQWGKEAFDGYEHTEAWPELRALITTAKRVGETNGCGRAMWDYEEDIARYGSEFAFTLLPFWTKGCIGSMEGLYLESSPSLPFQYINQSLLAVHAENIQARLPYQKLNITEGVKRLQQWGVRYYFVFSPTAQAQARVHRDLSLVATTPYTRECTPDETTSKTCPTTMEIYQVSGSDLVEGLPREPVVVTGIGASQNGGWLDVAMAQYIEQDRFAIPFAADGPKSWTRAKATVNRGFSSNFGSGTMVASTPAKELPPVQVTDIVEGNGDVRFQVDRVGVPVVVKVSYYPTWRAKGADGPFRLAPNLMVVVPRQKDVTLRIEQDAANHIGTALSVIGLAGLGASAIAERRRRSRPS
jgi:hypothetical protein